MSDSKLQVLSYEAIEISPFVGYWFLGISSFLVFVLIGVIGQTVISKLIDYAHNKNKRNHKITSIKVDRNNRA